MKTLYILLAAVLWGMIGLFTQFLSAAGIDAGTLVLVRAAGAAGALVLYMLCFQRAHFRIQLKDLPYFAGTGIVSFVFFNFCYFRCISLCSLSVAAILLYTAPVFVMILSFVIFRETFSVKKGIALFCTICGCIFVSGIFGNPAGLQTAGIIFGILSGLFYGLYTIFGQLVLKRYSAETVTLYTFIFAGLGALPLCDPKQIAEILQHGELLLLSLGLIFLSTVVPFLLYTKGLLYVPAGTASILATLEPVVATVVGIFFFHDAFTWIHLAGIGLIIGADILLIFPHKRLRA